MKLCNEILEKNCHIVFFSFRAALDILEWIHSFNHPILLKMEFKKKTIWVVLFQKFLKRFDKQFHQAKTSYF